MSQIILPEHPTAQIVTKSASHIVFRQITKRCYGISKTPKEGSLGSLQR